MDDFPVPHLPWMPTTKLSCSEKVAMAFANAWTKLVRRVFFFRGLNRTIGR